MEEVYEWSQQGQAIGFRGPTGSGSGVHLLTGAPYAAGLWPVACLVYGKHVGLVSMC